MKTAFAALLAAVAMAVASPFASDSLPQQDAGLRPAPGEPAQQPPQEQPGQLTLSVDGTPLTVRWEDNASVDALRELAQEQEFTVETSNYGGFEQVGDLPQGIVSDDPLHFRSAGRYRPLSGTLGGAVLWQQHLELHASRPHRGSERGAA